MKTGTLCRPEASRFPLDSHWVMALELIEEIAPGGFNPNTPNVSHGRIGDYSLSSCGGFWLSVSENLVTGNLANGTRWVMEPKMTPVIMDLVVGFVQGRVEAQALLDASREDPALREMMLNTRSFVREERYESN